MAQFAVLCMLMAVVRVQSQGELFRTELFPEQLQQQQVQFMQRQIQDHLQLLQRQTQAATSIEQQVSQSGRPSVRPSISDTTLCVSLFICPEYLT
jgi:hypothetical protein